MGKSSIADKLSAQRSTNNFDLIRFIAAALVILSHCFSLAGKEFEPLSWLSGYETFGGLAVAIFFITSGFLITASWFSDENILSFIKKRILRIFPALIWVIFLTVFVLGPLLTALPLKEYFKNHTTYLYLNNVYLTCIYYSLPGVFAHNPWPNAVNGSLWTLPIEILMYAMIGFLGSIRLLKMKWFIPALLPFAFYLFISYYISHSNTMILWVRLSQTAKLAIYFIMGSIFYIYREKIILSVYIFVPAVIIYFLGYGHDLILLYSLNL
jgi:peptidoglycan/LPS O-acetylase OafA/YrhL